MAAPKGNSNAKRGTDWRDALRYELARIGRDYEGDDPAYVKGLRECAKGFIDAAKSGEAWALKELGDRFDGKPTQAVDMDIEGDMNSCVEVVFPQWDGDEG